MPVRSPSVRPWPFDQQNPRILIPEGRVQISPKKSVIVSAFRIARTDVTVGQMRRFLEETKGVELRAIVQCISGERRELLANSGEDMDALYQRATGIFPGVRKSRIELLEHTLGGVLDFPENKHGENHPVVKVDWETSRAFCRHYDEGDLLTACQYLHAARGKSGKDEYGTPIDRAITWETWGREHRHTAPVCGSEDHRRENGWGVTDLAGNVRKWLRDRFDLDFFHRLQDGERDPVNEDPQRPNFRMHGGTWRGDRNFARAADWTEGYPWEQYIDGGFRPAWPVDIT